MKRRHLGRGPEQWAQIAMDYTRENLPEEFAKIEDPEKFFADAGWEIVGQVAEVLHQLVGDPLPGESLTDYERRCSHSQMQAEEIVLADHYLLTGGGEKDDEPDTTDDPELEDYYRDLAEVNTAIGNLYR
jgi:hypothetical protein